jgi:hypothetical protein
MRAKAGRKKRKPIEVVAAKKGDKVAIMSVPHPKEMDSGALSKLIETGSSDPKTEKLSRLTDKVKTPNEYLTKPKEVELEQRLKKKEGLREEKLPDENELQVEEKEKE